MLYRFHYPAAALIQALGGIAGASAMRGVHFRDNLLYL